MRTVGIDLSHHNGNWDPDRMDPSIEFVVHKATEGSTYKDPKYLVGHADALRAGLLWGAYHVLRETSSPKEQAEWFLHVAALGPGEFAALDLETKHVQALVEKWGQLGACRQIQIWLVEVSESIRARPLVYLSRRGQKALGVQSSWPTQWPVWWVDYMSPNCAPAPARPWLLWQYTSSQPGAWAGVSSKHIDVNICQDIEMLKACAVPPKIEPLPPEKVFRESFLKREIRKLRLKVTGEEPSFADGYLSALYDVERVLRGEEQ